MLELISPVVERRPRNEMSWVAADRVVTPMPQPHPDRDWANEQLVHRHVRLQAPSIPAARPDAPVPEPRSPGPNERPALVFSTDLDAAVQPLRQQDPEPFVPRTRHHAASPPAIGNRTFCRQPVSGSKISAASGSPSLSSRTNIRGPREPSSSSSVSVSSSSLIRRSYCSAKVSACLAISRRFAPE